MQRLIRTTVVATSFVAVFAGRAAAQAGSIVADLMTDVGQVEKKLVGLARAIPADKYNWRPGTGVRSIGEVLLHLGSDNYLIPIAVGVPADPATGITSDYKTAQAYENRKLTKDQIVAEVEKSFAHVKKAMTNTPAAKLGDKVNMFGQSFTTQQVWILAVTHLHEHLGQMIAYARSNSIAPPWSQ